MSPSPPGPSNPPDPAAKPAVAASPDAVDVEPVLGTLTLAPPEGLTAEDLAARANVGFALDLEPFLPGPPVGSERVLLEEDPEAARRLGVRAEPVPTSPETPSPALEPPPAPSPAAVAPPPPAPDTSHIDVEPVLDAATDLPPAPPRVDAAPTPPGDPPPAAHLVWSGGPPSPAPPVAPTPPMEPVRPRAGISQPAPLPSQARTYPVAWSWAGLGSAPVFGASRAPPRPVRAPPDATARSGKASMEEMLDLAAVGKGADGVTEMLLIFKEDVLRGLTCRLRMEPAGMQAHFVAPDDGVRRYVEGTAEDLLARMRRRGLKVAGWTVEVGG